MLQRNIIQFNLLAEYSELGGVLVANGGRRLYLAYVALAYEQQRLQELLKPTADTIQRLTQLSWKEAQEWEGVLQEAVAETPIIK